MYVFKQGDIEIVRCGEKAIVSYKDHLAVINLRMGIDNQLRGFPEKFREFVKKKIMESHE
jgi:hypothetical protein